MTEHGKVFGIDIAKSAVRLAAKKFKAFEQMTWLVGTANRLPIMDGALDVCTSFFSSMIAKQVVRVLKTDGLFIVAVAGSHHLYEIRQQLFDEVYLHDLHKVLALLQHDFQLLEKRHIRCDLQLNRSSLADLIAMTPYAIKQERIKSSKHFIR